MHKGSEVSGSRLWKSYNGFRYHVAERGGQYYLCDCHQAIRINGRIKYCHGKRFDKSKRRPVFRSTTTLWVRTHTV